MRFIMNLAVGMAIVLTVFTAGTPSVGGAAGSSIVINELMYDPDIAELEGEWVELFNPGTSAINVLNWTISDQDGDADFVFPDMSFPPNSYAVIHVGQGQNSTDFIDGKAEFYMWKTSSIWSGTGDDVLLANSTGASIDFLSYGQWNGSSVDPPPADIACEHSNASAEEGFSLALVSSQFRQSVPTPLEYNGNDVSPGVLFTEVYYDTYGENEYVKIHNPLPVAVDVSHWYLTDGEGIIYFPSGTVLEPGQSFTISQNSTNYAAQALGVPDFEYYDINSSIPDMLIIDYEPGLANDGDELFLFNTFSAQIDAFVYGSSEYGGTGWDSEPAPDVSQGRIAKRAINGTYADTNTSADWLSPRPYVIGQSDFQDAVITTSGPMTFFTSPDSSFQVVTGVIDSAEQEICLNLYEFTNTRLADHLAAAISRGVAVRMFLEGSPVGGMNETQLFIARRIVEAGGSVRILTNDPGNDIHARYDYDHAKYAVVDDRKLLIMSENWGWTGVPPTGEYGNRGWGAVIDSPGLAGYFKSVFEHDWNPSSPDSVAFDSAHGSWDAGTNWSHNEYDCQAIFEPYTTSSPAHITPVIAPDTALSNQTILGMLASAQERVCVEEFYIYKHWGDKVTGSVEETPNSYLEAVIEAARRGCEVRILLDATYYNMEETDPIDNDDTVEYVNDLAAAEDLDLQAKVVNLYEHDFAKIHNKGLIADDKVLISSINWNLNSVTENRESGIIIENHEAAEYFIEVFEHDWTDDLTPPIAHFSISPTYQVNTTVMLNASTSSDNMEIVNYTWYLVGQPICWGVNFTHNFTSCGLYSLNLTVKDAWNNVDYVAHTLNITAEASSNPDDPVNPGDPEITDGGDDDLMTKVMGVMLLVPIFVFVVIIYVMRVRNR